MPDLSSLSPFFLVAGGLALVMLVWDTVEVGRNDAANLVNAVFGARLMNRRNAVWLAGLAVVLGATLSSAVIETARKGIFTPSAVAQSAGSADEAFLALIAIYLSVYIVDTVLLYGYSAFGIPVSTTATLVFTLVGASAAVGGPGVINWPVFGKVIGAIILSIILTGFAAFLIQRAVRAAIRDREQDLPTMLAHGGWVGGGMAAGLCYFLLLKGMKQVTWVRQLHKYLDESIGTAALVFLLWGAFALIIHALLLVFGRKAARLLFPGLAILGMVAMAFAFGQNDLANCASAGLAILTLIGHFDQGVDAASEVGIPPWALFLTGIVLMLGMTTRNAQRVTKAAASAGSMGDHVELWAPNWCLSLAGIILRRRGRMPSLAPRLPPTEAGKVRHYDALRASVIMSVSASVIATASARGLPVSTTYVAFAAVIATGIADRIFQHGDAILKLARSIWVILSWFLAAAIAVVAGALVGSTILHLGMVGIGLAVALNLAIRRFLRIKGDAHEKRVREEARERMDPDRYALEEA